MNQEKKILFILDPISKMHHEDDTSFSLMLECFRRSHQLFFCESKHLKLNDSTVFALLSKCIPDIKKGVLVESVNWYDLRDFDLIFLRKEPPFNMDYLSLTYLLDFISDDVLCINNPQSVRSFNEKISILNFSKWIPKTIVGSSYESMRNDMCNAGHEHWVVKPLYNKGGKGIFKISVNNDFEKEFNFLTKNQRIPVMAQRYIEHEFVGDKRILILDGEPLGAFTRIPPKHDFRANMHLGGVAKSAIITQHELNMIEDLAPFFRDNGLYFVGIDVIDGYLSEINVTSPAGIPEVNSLNNQLLEEKVIDLAELELTSLSRRCKLL